MKLTAVKKCYWCEEEFTGRRYFMESGGHYDGDPCWCSYDCLEAFSEHNDEMEQLMSENLGLQHALMRD